MHLGKEEHRMKEEYVVEEREENRREDFNLKFCQIIFIFISFHCVFCAVIYLNVL